MKIILPISISLFVLSACGNMPVKQLNPLAGKWRHDVVVLHLANGAQHQVFNPDCNSHYTTTRLTVICRQKGKIDRAVYAYRMLDSNKYEATLVQNKRTPHLLGTKAITDFSLKNGYLEMITYYPKPDNASSGHITKIESALIRE